MQALPVRPGIGPSGSALAESGFGVVHLLRFEPIKPQPQTLKRIVNHVPHLTSLLTACGMYVVERKSSVTDLRIWDKKALFSVGLYNLSRKSARVRQYLDQGRRGR